MAAGSDSEDEFASSPSSSDNDDDDDEDVVIDEEEELDDEDEPQVLSQAELKARNVQAMLSGSLQTSRKPMVAGLKCQDAAAVLAQPFKTPFAGATAGHSAELARRLAARRRFVPWGSTSNIAPMIGRPLGLGGFTPPMGAKPEARMVVVVVVVIIHSASFFFRLYGVELYSRLIRRLTLRCACVVVFNGDAAASCGH